MLFVGRKGSGKSEAAKHIFRWWPGLDKLVLDINHDIDLGDDMDVQHLPSEPPLELPERRKREVPEVYHWAPDPRRGSMRDDIDRAIGLCLFPKDRRVLKWTDEAGVAYKVHESGPNGTTVQNQNRHYKAPQLFCCPRPKNIETLVLSQSDRIFMWDVPSPGDRQRLADNMGVPPRDLDRELARREHEMPQFSYLMFMAGPPDQRGLYLCPPMPLT
jgi:hypothetical protein